MPAPKNALKAALIDGEVQTACWLGMADPYVAEMAAHTGWDVLVLDGEHAPNDMRSFLGQLQALENSDSSVMVRLPVGERHLIKQALDLGAQSMLIPMIESADQAREMAQAMLYPPHGTRGVGAALARASQFNHQADYQATADAEMCLFVQVENRAGLSALEEICQVDGVDGVFIGPADLAADMGLGQDFAAPELRQAIADAAKTIQAAGKFAGILTLDPDYAAQCKTMGFQFIATAVDVLLYRSAMTTAAKLLK